MRGAALRRTWEDRNAGSCFPRQVEAKSVQFARGFFAGFGLLRMAGVLLVSVSSRGKGVFPYSRLAKCSSCLPLSIYKTFQTTGSPHFDLVQLGKVQYFVDRFIKFCKAQNGFVCCPGFFYNKSFSWVSHLQNTQKEARKLGPFLARSQKGGGPSLWKSQG